jgi:hypothetical protein
MTFIRNTSLWGRALFQAAVLPLAAWPMAATAQTVPVGFVAGVSNPEDLVRVPGTPWVVVSAMRSQREPGQLLLVDTRKPEHATQLYPASSQIAHAPDPARFAPHGIDIRPLGEERFELLVVDHGNGEGIDRFLLRAHGGALVVESVSRVESPVVVWANAVAAMPDGGFVITSMYDPRDETFVAKFARAQITGGVWRWSEALGWRQLSRPTLSGGNGIAVSPDGNTVFVAEWAARRIWRVPMNGADPRSTAVPFLPDNLRWSDAGDLLIAGQTASPQEVFTCGAEGRHCPMGFVVARINPETLAVQSLLSGDDGSFAQTGFGGATGAMQVGDEVWVGSFTGSCIARYALPAAAKTDR